MTNKRIHMVIQQEIARLKKLGLTQRKSAQILGISRNSIGRYWEQDSSQHPLEGDSPPWVQKLDWNYIKEELERKTPKKILFQELSSHHQLPTYANFCRYINIKLPPETKASEVTMHIVRTPGHSVEVDYSGDGWDILSPSTAKIMKAQLFVGAMSYSSDFYAEFTWTQKLEDFIESHNRMFSFFGGVPLFIIPDHCKTAIVGSDGFDDQSNQVYHDMCVYYGIIIDAARSLHPRDKPNVERSVGILQQDFFPRIRNNTYTSLWALNKDLHDYIINKREEVMKGRGQSRAALFEVERPHLRSLPTSPYEIYYFKMAKVHPDCHIQHARNFYSVPYRNAGKVVTVRYNQKMVYISIDGESLAVHKTLHGNGHYSTVSGHYPEKKIVDMDIVVLSLKRDAGLVGPNTNALVEKLFDEPRHPLKNLRKVQGLMGLSKKVSHEAMEHASEMAIFYNKLRYAFIKQCCITFAPQNNIVIFKAPKRSLDTICLQGNLK